MASRLQEQTPARAYPRVLLLSLAAELLDQIASYLDLESFRALRLTASRYKVQTTRLFKKRFFTTQHLQWGKLSLQRLVDVSEDLLLGGACQHLVIDATPHHALLLWKTRRRSADAGHMTPITDDEDGSNLVKRLNDDYKLLEEKAENETRWLNETRFDLKCLTTAFPRLTSLESITFAYQGMEARYSKFAGRYCEASQHEMSRPFISTLFALATSKITVRHIKIHDENKHGAVSVGRLESLAPLLRGFDLAFELLETLHLNLRDWRRPSSAFELETTRAPFVVRFLAKCSNIRVLHLSCYSVPDNTIFTEMARTCRFKKLEQCKLDSLPILQAADLIEFLTVCSGSLKELELQYIVLADPASAWIELFASLSDTPSLLTSLQSLKVSRLLSDRDPLLFLQSGSRTTSLHIEGDDWRAQLKDLSCEPEQLDGAMMWLANATIYPFVTTEEHIWRIW